MPATIKRAALAIYFFFPVSARAETLSLSDCLARSRERSLQVIQSDLSLRQAQAALSEGKGRRRPQLAVVGALEKSDDASKQLEGSNQAVIRVEQAVYPFSAEWVRGRQQAAQVEAAALSKLESQSDVELAVKQLYFAVLNADQALESLGRAEDKLARLRETFLPRFQVGGIPQFDLIKVKSAAADLARSRELVKADRAARKSELAQFMGLASGADFELKPSSGLPELPGADTIEEHLPDNPTVRVLAKQIDVDEWGVKAARRKRLPDLVAGFDYGDSGPTTSSMPPGWSFTAGLRLPLYDWGQISSQVDQQRSQADLSRNRLEQENQKERTALVQAEADAQAHLADQKRLVELLPETQSAAAASIGQYRRGAMTILEATDALNLWLSNMLNERGAYYAYLSDLARLERLSGGAAKVDYGR